MATEQQARKRKGCLFYGCLAATIMAILLAILAYGSFRFLTNQVIKYTEDQPRDLPKIEVSDEEWQRIQQKLREFESAYEQGREHTLVLDEEEINAIIAMDENYKDLRGKVFILIPDNQVQAEISFPLAELQISRLKNRYMNGSAILDVGLKDGELKVFIKSLEVKGEPLDKAIADQLLQENVAKDLYDNPDAAKVIQKLQSVEVRDRKVFITSKEGNPAAPAQQ
jgi:hypothetical protein